MARSVLIFGLFLAPFARGTAQQGLPRLWSVDDRVILSDFSTITSVAAGPDRVVVTSPTSLVIWEPLVRRWKGPFDPPDPSYLSGVFASLLDPLDYSVWLASHNGWSRYDTNIDAWDRGLIPARVLTIAFDRANPGRGLFFRTSGGWFEVERGSMIAAPSSGPLDPEVPKTVQDVLRENPWFEANQAAVLRTARLGTARYTVAARSFDRQGWYIGTSGAGLLYAEEGAAIPTPLSFGLPSERVGAVFDGPGGVWVATDRTVSSEATITFVDRRLTEFKPLDESAVFGVRFNQATRMVGRDAFLWVASDLGVVRVGTDGRSADVVDESRGLPDRHILSLAARRGTIAVGTARGLAVITDSLEVRRVAPDFAGRAFAVAIGGDTLWVGTGLGVFLALPESGDLERPVGLGPEPSLRQPVVDLDWLADTLVALTPDHLMWRDPITGVWTLGPLLSPQLGRLRTLLPDRGGMWIAGDRGVGAATLATPSPRTLLVGRDLPAEVTDLAVDDEFLWVATMRGLVRWRLEAVRP
ncbi:MAG TPA: hypothetical protein VK845_04785 [Gemmatimonadales bacterium]|nr:hypothetical protein [Gemmatimonadales bacterium]